MADKNSDVDDDNFSDENETFQAHKPSNLFVDSAYDDSYEETPQEKLEHTIMEEVLHSENEEVEEKLKELLEKLPKKNDEEILTIRMHELALSKILVFTHGKSDFRLVKAHYHIGEAYLNYKCYEQAIDHLTVSLKKNAKLTEIKETKLYHSYMLTTLSRCYFEINSFDDALEVLTRAYDIQQGCISTEGPINNVETLELIASCHLKLKSYQSAIDYINITLDLIVKIYTEQSKEYALANVLKSKIHTESKDITKGIEAIKHSIEILNSINYQDREQVAKLYETLSNYYESFGDYDKEIKALRNKYEVLEEIYGHSDRKALGAKRSVAMTLLKREKFVEAIEELEEVQEIEEKVYGENSTQVGKTLKVLGTVHMRNKNTAEAEHCFKKGQKILHEQGHPKLVKEIKAKLSFLKELKEGTVNDPAA